jgi:putative DNA primase/helicase
MSFLQFAAERGLHIRHLEKGRWARVPTIDHPHKRNGAYFYGGDFAFVQNWAIQETADVWQENKLRTPFEQKDFENRIAEGKKQYALERAEGQRKAASKAAWILSQCELDQHAYLDLKGFPNMLGNVWRKDSQPPILVIPMYFNSKICGCQLIDILGNKKFLTGQRTNDAAFTFDAKGRVFLVEGYATALSLKAALTALKTQYVIHACFSAGNLLRMAKTHQSAFVIADNDKSGTGERVAIASGCKWFMPNTEGEDFNDMHQRIGTFQASMALRKAF